MKTKNAKEISSNKVFIVYFVSIYRLWYNFNRIYITALRSISSLVSDMKTQELLRASLELWIRGCRSQEGYVHHHHNIWHNTYIKVDTRYINMTSWNAMSPSDEPSEELHTKWHWQMVVMWYGKRNCAYILFSFSFGIISVCVWSNLIFLYFVKAGRAVFS